MVQTIALLGTGTMGFGMAQVLLRAVLGTKKPGAEGALVVLAAGDPDLRARDEPVFDAIDSETVWVGNQVGLASALKLVCNAWVGTITAAVGQSMALAAGLGLDADLFLTAIKGGATDTPYAQVSGAQILAEEFPPPFALDGAIKDLDLILAAADEAKIND
jgi:3-hydroxyisobutyrate dehydrogenase